MVLQLFSSVFVFLDVVFIRMLVFFFVRPIVSATVLVVCAVTAAEQPIEQTAATVVRGRCADVRKLCAGQHDDENNREKHSKRSSVTSASPW